MALPITTAAFPFLLAVFWMIWVRKPTVKAPYPPGPPPDPIIGHLRAFPKSGHEQAFREMSKTYGDVLYFHVLGKSFLILNSRKTATEILDQRSGIYSDRELYALIDIMGWGSALSNLPYGRQFQKHRRLVHEHLHEKQSVSYHPLQVRYARRLLVNLIDNPAEWNKHFERFSASLIVKIAYGMDIAERGPDKYLDIAEQSIASLAACGAAGYTPVDFFPFLKNFPSWFPGTYYASKARSFRDITRQMHEYPFETVMQRMKDGTAQQSYLVYHLKKIQEEGADEQHLNDVKSTAALLFLAGAETTSSVLAFFVLAMVLFPEVQKLAQREIDAVIGSDRLPDMSDRESLPYVEAVIHEVLRWNTVLPLCIPHRSTEDDIYNGMYIPKGTMVIANNYAILRDETVYSNPDSFNPSRYLPKPVGNAEPPPVGQFGFGRRICPGQYLASASLFIVVASVLATMNIGRARDENGMEIVPEVELITGITSHPKPFPCTIISRNKMMEGKIRQAQMWDDC